MLWLLAIWSYKNRSTLKKNKTLSFFTPALYLFLTVEWGMFYFTYSSVIPFIIFYIIFYIHSQFIHILSIFNINVLVPFFPSIVCVRLAWQLLNQYRRAELFPTPHISIFYPSHNTIFLKLRCIVSSIYFLYCYTVTISSFLLRRIKIWINKICILNRISRGMLIWCCVHWGWKFESYDLNNCFSRSICSPRKLCLSDFVLRKYY